MLLTQALKLNLRQSEVDFIIPNIAKDLKLYIDPYLFYQNEHKSFQAVHATLHEFFALAIEHVNKGTPAVAERMLDFPEVKETMLGMTKGSHRGRGMGQKYGRLIYEEIVANADIQEKGITHLAEMQLLIEGVGYDLVSDMCTNIVKPFFVDYTRKQAALHGIPLEFGICLEHVFQWDSLTWEDIHTNLPVNPKNGNPILLVPKAVVRRFPMFDYRDFWNSTYRYVLRDAELGRSVRAIGKQPKITWKEINQKYEFTKKTVVKALHETPELRHAYVEHLERRKKDVIEPADLFKVAGTGKQETNAAEFRAQLQALRPGKADAKRYEALILRILTKLFSPPLHDPEAQVGSHDGREYVDITFYNNGKDGFWQDLKQLWRAQLVVFELKNMEDLSNEEFFQLAARLNDVRGFFGVLVSRKRNNFDLERAYRRLNNERKVLMILTDDDLLTMLDGLDNGKDATDAFQAMYREFIDKQ
ncbi:MAG: hypothetical protein ACM3SS_11735 [Rhodospirillaceae bacterium]